MLADLKSQKLRPKKGSKKIINPPPPPEPKPSLSCIKVGYIPPGSNGQDEHSIQKPKIFVPPLLRRSCSDLNNIILAPPEKCENDKTSRKKLVRGHSESSDKGSSIAEFAASRKKHITPRIHEETRELDIARKGKHPNAKLVKQDSVGELLTEDSNSDNSKLNKSESCILPATATFQTLNLSQMERPSTASRRASLINSNSRGNIITWGMD